MLCKIIYKEENKLMKIENIEISEKIQKGLEEMGFEELTQIQLEAIPHILEGKDIIAQSNTGTGKTAAFGIPVIQSIDTEIRKPQAIAICPTRELAVQVANEFKKMSKFVEGLKIVSVYGGADIKRQIDKLRNGAQIIIGTPGRIIDLINRGVIKLEQLKTTILDEADEMLKMGFKEDIELILSNVHHKTQTLLFSATIPASIKKITKQFQKDPVEIKTLREGITAKEVKQSYFIVKHSDKIEALSRVIDTYTTKLALVFCNTKRSVDELFDVLVDRGYNCDKIHGDINQAQRLDTLNKFNNGLVDVLIATDVAARGLDIKEVEAVINFDIPVKEDYYVHRIGRTGRAGREGLSFTLLTNKEMSKLRAIEKYTKKSIRKRSIPTIDKVNEIKQDKFIRQIEEQIANCNTDEYAYIIKRLFEDGNSPESIINALIKDRLTFNNADNDKDLNDNTPERRKSSRKREDEINRSGVRFFVNVGKKDGIRPKDILGAVAGECNIPGSDIGAIEILDKFSFFTAAKEHKNVILDKMNNSAIKGRDVVVEITTSKKSSSKSSSSNYNKPYKNNGRRDSGKKDGGKFYGRRKK
ncbi:DEAD/DEAH box helicase [Sedimentibacter sp. zth1]|uniref:DEAD/DEAH box helicase n=1 Tax=Sedimentibacter sp. zth1 TaxID=2816908 RepID=UPI001A91244F|nr:DEAD/DEAH box helicase [Sedimentibacter sp. zth1]QSX06378.1 DEAD/DEAH box helicase [Sedimentibacter sp. zth1]